VLSHAADDSCWRGERGQVAAVIPRALQRGAHAYLCGPPGMIDSAIGLLSQRGVPPDLIHADRFIASGGASAAGLNNDSGDDT
jgi:3-phenylpropionate/trans-cinnamate dioxygenase ferredoxin reductase subunit